MVVFGMKQFYGIDNHPADSRVTLSKDGKFQTLSSRMGTGGGNTPMCLITDEREDELVKEIVRRLTPLECERLQGYPDGWTLIGEPREVEVKDKNEHYKLIVTDNGDLEIEEDKDKVGPFSGKHKETKYFYNGADGKEHECTDSARYKALGNSIALPQWKWIAERMQPHLRTGATLGSLFDGISGFSLVWQQTYGSGTARWSSEIEEFPIAVAKQRIGDDDLGIKGDYETLF